MPLCLPCFFPSVCPPQLHPCATGLADFQAHLPASLTGTRQTARPSQSALRVVTHTVKTDRAMQAAQPAAVGSPAASGAGSPAASGAAGLALWAACCAASTTAAGWAACMALSVLTMCLTTRRVDWPAAWLFA